jgi:hypothetical protein
MPSQYPWICRHGKNMTELPLLVPGGKISRHCHLCVQPACTDWQSGVGSCPGFRCLDVQGWGSGEGERYICTMRQRLLGQSRRPEGNPVTQGRASVGTLMNQSYRLFSTMPVKGPHFFTGVPARGAELSARLSGVLPESQLRRHLSYAALYIGSQH